MTLKDWSCYIAITLIWGTAWLVISIHNHYAPIETSILYRTAIAGLLLLGWCIWRKKPLKFSWKTHFCFLLTGVLMFSFNLILFYYSTIYLVSGLAAILFAMTCLFNILNNYLFLRIIPRKQSIVGCFFGILGLLVFFWHEINECSIQKDTLIGIAFGLLGTYFFSLANIVSKKCHEAKLDITSNIAYSICYGALTMLIYVMYKGIPFTLPSEFEYWAALGYMSLCSSVIAYLSYVRLIREIGTEKVAYTVILTPVIALWTSFFFEGYRWTAFDVAGLIMILLGNFLVLKSRELNDELGNLR